VQLIVEWLEMLGCQLLQGVPALSEAADPQVPGVDNRSSATAEQACRREIAQCISVVAHADRTLCGPANCC